MIIFLGFLVDDAVIAVEMMIVKLRQGWSRFDAAGYAYQATSFPMLTGTLITCAGFIPIGFSRGSASEFVGSIFTVITIALLLSWIVSVLATPLLGYSLLKTETSSGAHSRDIYNNRFYRLFRIMLAACLLHRKKVLLIIMRNSVILIDQIGQHQKAGGSVWESIINATLFRSIMLTAAAAIRGILPLMPNVFWGPMAVTIAGGLFVATVADTLSTPGDVHRLVQGTAKPGTNRDLQN